VEPDAKLLNALIMENIAAAAMSDSLATRDEVEEVMQKPL
jgi:hypothetical protein